MINTWQAILEEAENQTKVEDIIHIAAAEYPQDESLLAACDAYRAWHLERGDTERAAPRPARTTIHLSILYGLISVTIIAALAVLAIILRPNGYIATLIRPRTPSAIPTVGSLRP